MAGLKLLKGVKRLNNRPLNADPAVFGFEDIPHEFPTDAQGSTYSFPLRSSRQNATTFWISYQLSFVAFKSEICAAVNGSQTSTAKPCSNAGQPAAISVASSKLAAPINR
jgi:hypothetical protein